MIVCMLTTLAHVALAQLKVLSLNDVRDLIKSGVSSSRISQLVEEHGVNFELDERTLRTFKREGANDNLVAAVKKAADRYRDERQELLRQMNRKRQEA
ncbi:MAG TPA: hypothetical protein VGA27_05180, partial [Candidatus Binatia bacterium]